MNGYERLIQEDIRISILLVLNSDGDYSHNEFVLKAALKHVGHGISSDRLRSELNWLNEQGLVVTEDAAGLIVAKLTARGQDVATGNVTVPGVKRPAPEL